MPEVRSSRFHENSYRTSSKHLGRLLKRVDDRFMGTPIDVDPHEAILHGIRLAAGEVAYCDAQIRKLEEDELFERPTRSKYIRLPSGNIELVEEQRDFEVISRWVRLRREAVDRMVRYSKIAVDAGIDERRVAVIERVADILVPLLMDLGDDLQLNSDQRQELPRIIGERLRALEAIPNGKDHFK